MSVASTSRPGTITAAGGGVIAWRRPAAANVARSDRLPTPISRLPDPARLRRFRRVRIGAEARIRPPHYDLPGAWASSATARLQPLTGSVYFASRPGATRPGAGIGVVAQLVRAQACHALSLIHISEPTRLGMIS